MTGAELKALRTRMGLKQTELAERLRIAGNTVARMERDEQVITPPMELLIGFIAREAGVDLASHTVRSRRTVKGKRAHAKAAKVTQG